MPTPYQPHPPGLEDIRASGEPGTFLARPNFYFHHNQHIHPARLPIQREPNIVPGFSSETDYPCEYRDSSTWTVDGPWCADCDDPDGDWVLVVAQTEGEMIRNANRQWFGKRPGRFQDSNLWDVISVPGLRIPELTRVDLISDPLRPRNVLGFVPDLWLGNTGRHTDIPTWEDYQAEVSS